MSVLNAPKKLGVLLSSNVRITHGSAANVKKPFKNIDLVMHELCAGGKRSFSGQLGFIPFRADFRLPALQLAKTKIATLRTALSAAEN